MNLSPLQEVIHHSQAENPVLKLGDIPFHSIRFASPRCMLSVSVRWIKPTETRHLQKVERQLVGLPKVYTAHKDWMSWSIVSSSQDHLCKESETIVLPSESLSSQNYINNVDSGLTNDGPQKLTVSITVFTLQPRNKQQQVNWKMTFRKINMSSKHTQTYAHMHNAIEWFQSCDLSQQQALHLKYTKYDCVRVITLSPFFSFIRLHSNLLHTLTHIHAHTHIHRAFFFFIL